MPVVWKEETVVFERDRVRVERTALGIVGGQSKVVEAVLFLGPLKTVVPTPLKKTGWGPGLFVWVE